MSREAVSARIAELDAISRVRRLSELESSHLEKLITVERRYDYSRARRPREVC